jgi:hypothetical protein
MSSHPDPQPSVIQSAESSAESNFFDPEDEANRALEAFRSIGIDAPLQVLILDDATKKPVRVFSNPSQAEVSTILTKWLPELTQRQYSLIFRMVGSAQNGQKQIVQVDDCDQATADRLRRFSFLQVETSPGSFHSWIAVDCQPERFLQLRDRLLKQLGSTGANGGSYGSMRWPGSRNFKVGRNGCAVEVVFRQFGRFVTEDELKAADLLAQPQQPQSRGDNITPTQHTDWQPSYQKELDRFNGDRSKADAAFACIELKVGWSEEDVKQHLLEVSDKAKQRHTMKYVNDTVRNAAARVK